MFVFGLGNPGSKYKQTRHNVGFMTIDKIAALMGLKLRKRCFYLYKVAYLTDKKNVLIEPLTYINNSGLVCPMVLKRGDTLLVICDQMDLPPGRIRIKRRGGSAGHNGLKSIINNWGEDFIHLYIGIGRPEGISVPDYVLSPFSPSEREKVDGAIDYLSHKIVELMDGKDLDEVIRDVNSFSI